MNLIEKIQRLIKKIFLKDKNIHINKEDRHSYDAHLDYKMEEARRPKV